MAEARRETHYLRVNFTPEELSDFSKALARETTALTEAEENKKAAVGQFAGQIALSRAVTSKLARQINDGYEMRDVKCDVQLHTPIAGIARIIRSDTKEVVRERLMTDEERQDQLPFGGHDIEKGHGAAG